MAIKLAQCGANVTVLARNMVRTCALGFKVVQLERRFERGENNECYRSGGGGGDRGA